MSILIEQLQGQDWIEWIGLLTGIAYVILAAYERPSCWIFGIVSCAAIGWKSLTEYRLMADAGLQVFYIVIGFIGLYQWVKGASELPKPIVTTPTKQHVIAIVVCVLLSFPIAWLLTKFAGARYGYPDTVLMLLSVYATWLLVKKDLHTWVYWIAIDIVYVFLYLLTDALLFALLFLVYAVVSVFGFFKWRLKYLPE